MLILGGTYLRGDSYSVFKGRILSLLVVAFSVSERIKSLTAHLFTGTTYQVFSSIVCLCDAGSTERISFNNIRSCFQVTLQRKW